MLNFQHILSCVGLNISSVGLHIYQWCDSDLLLSNIIELTNLVRIDFDIILETEFGPNSCLQNWLVLQGLQTLLNYNLVIFLVM